jgi:hypothetical protein
MTTPDTFPTIARLSHGLLAGRSYERLGYRVSLDGLSCDGTTTDLGSAFDVAQAFVELVGLQVASQESLK